jgi:hypothetical protein
VRLAKLSTPPPHARHDSADGFAWGKYALVLQVSRFRITIDNLYGLDDGLASQHLRFEGASNLNSQ